MKKKDPAVDSKKMPKKKKKAFKGFNQAKADKMAKRVFGL